MRIIRVIALCISCAIMSGVGSPASAQDEKETGWFLTGELSYVQTAGNSESNTVGAGATLRRVWQRSELKFDGGAVRTESSLKTRTAVGTSPQDFQLFETKTTEKTAENSFFRTRYDYSITSRFGAFGSVDWLRNVFAGIESRTLVAGGAFNTWVDNERVKFKTDYSATYTYQQDVVENPDVKKDFPGVRLSYDLLWKLTATADFTSVLIADLNLDNTDDVRADFTNALPVEISSKLALKPSVQLLWRNTPALTEVTLFDAGGTDTGEKVLVPLDELDTIVTVALVVKL